MRKLLSLLLTLVFILSAVPFGAFIVSADDTKYTEGLYTYSVSGGKATITYVNTSISGDVTIPDTLCGYPVTCIGDDAFWKCTRLTSITIPDSVTSIGRYAFWDCNNLTSITIPDSVTSIDYQAFYNCDSLTTINVDEENKNYCDIDGVLFNKAVTTLIQYPEGKTNTSYIIPDSVTSIGAYAFLDCTSLTSITISDSVTSIGWSAFSDCTSLTSITIPDSVTSIGDFTFSDCTSLTSITIPDSVISIGNRAFSDCTSLTSITIPDGVTSIGYRTFYNCDSLKDVYYRGAQEDKNSISIGEYNDDLLNATWHYNSCIGSATHNYDGENVCTVCGAQKPTVKSGDINDDDKINNKDLGLLMQYINQWGVEINIDAADVNDDTKINNKDYGILAQYINKWDVELQ